MWEAVNETGSAPMDSSNFANARKGINMKEGLILRIIRVGTRKSLLALVQTQLVVDKIRGSFPDLHIEIVTMSTKGDERLDRALASFGGKGVFTKELEEGLRTGAIDIAVHSAKDMPMELPDGLVIGAVPGRADVHDMLVVRSDDARFNGDDGLAAVSGMASGSGKGMCISDGCADRDFISSLPEGFVVGTGSLRRELQLKVQNPTLCVRSIRGNVQTRLEKLAQGQYDGIILAKAGITRLMQCRMPEDTFDYERFRYLELDTELMLPAAGQGILAVESRAGDLTEVLSAITDKNARLMLEAERAFLEAIGGSCNAPAAALSRVDGAKVRMTAVFAPDGEHLQRAAGSAALAEARALGVSLAEKLNK